MMNFIKLLILILISSVTSLSNLPAIRKNQGSISSTDSGHSEAGGYCEGNVYHITSSIIHNAPASSQNMAAPLPPRRHSAVQQGSNNSNLYQLIQPNSVNSSSSTKQANGDISSMPPPPNPRTRPVPPFPIGVPVLPTNAAVANVAGQYVYATSQQQYQQLRHTGKLINNNCSNFRY